MLSLFLIIVFIVSVISIATIAKELATKESKDISSNDQSNVEIMKQESNNWTNDFVKSLEWKRYEEVCKEFLIIKGYNAEVTCVGADEGVDIVIKNNNGLVVCVAQCKAFGKKPVGVALIRELCGIMASKQVKKGLFFTTSTFSEDAIKFATSNSISLVDLESFVRAINTLDDSKKIRLYDVASDGDFNVPTCARCDVKMIERVSRKTDRKFWGCANYPKCRMTINIRG